MNCTICGQESMPGAKLCADCRAARKRAFAATVTQPLLEAAGARRSRSSARLLKPSQSIAATARRAARKAKAEAGSQLVATPSPRRGLLPVILIGVVLVLIAGAYGAHRLNTADAPEAHVGTGAAEGSAATLAVPPPVAAPVTPAIPVQPGAASNSAVHANEIAPPPAVSAPPPKKLPARQRAAPAPAVIALPESDSPPAIVVAAPAPAPPPPPQPAARVDPWQQLNEGMSGCAREDLATRLRCEQRIRVRYCEGQWGVAAQCPIGPNTDHGQ